MTRTTTRPEHRLSQYVAQYQLADGQYAIWNTLFPEVSLLTQAGLDGLRALPREQDAWPAGTLEELRNKRILYIGDYDPYADEFFSTADRHIARMDADAKRFYNEALPYEKLYIVNSGCNLGCSYCVSYYGDDARQDAKREATRGTGRHALVLNVVDQFIERTRRAGKDRTGIAFNGGEILLRWQTVRQILEHVEARHPDFTVEYHMNTNATLLTEDVAGMLAKYKVDISVSIDGYEELHDQSRVHHGGGKSFDKVMAGVSNYRKATKEPFVGYQGTIENIADFDDEQFFAMAAHGFDRARLAPNLLDHKDPKRGQEAAFWESALTVESQRRDVALSSTEFSRTVMLAGDGRAASGFTPHCGGLTGTGGARALVLNMDSMQLSHLCSFSSPAAVPMASVGNNIHDPAIWEATRKYITDRIEMLRTACRGCSVLGVCQGGCVYTALDVHNKLNPAGCAYQRALWRHAIDYNHSGEIRRLAPTNEDAHTTTDGRGCGPHEQQRAPDGRKIWAVQARG